MQTATQSTRVHKPLEVEQKQSDFNTITVTPLNPVIGAEIGGIDLSKGLSPKQLKEVKQAWLDHHVLIFRNQVLTADDHKRFARMFGKLHVHPYNAQDLARPDHANDPGKRGDKEVLVVRADQNSRFVAGEGWHTDVSCDPEPPRGSMLYITKTPGGGGGDTCYASTVRAYEALSPAMKAFISGLTATHDGAKPYTGGYGTAAPPGGWPKNTHPVVITVPDSDRKSLYVNRGFTTQLNELNREESDGLLELLWRHIETHVEFQCRVHWEPNMLVFWDNWCTHHHAVWDYYPHSRYGQRVSLIDGRPAA